jgi:hypothetical protein
LLKEKLTFDMSEYDLVKRKLILDMSKYDFEMFVKRKVDFRHIQIWLWVQSWKKDLTLGMLKYDFEYACQRKSWFWTLPNMILNVFIKGKVDFRHYQKWLWVQSWKGKFDFRHVQIRLWVCLSKEKLTLDVSKYDFEYVCQKKSWL